MPLTKVKLKIKLEEVPQRKLRKASEGGAEPVSLQPSVGGERGAAQSMLGVEEAQEAAQPTPLSTAESVSPATKLTGLQSEAMKARAEAVQPGVVREKAEPVRHPRLAPAFRKVWRVPRVRLREAGRLEGAEVPLPPITGRLVRTQSGYLIIGDGVVRVYAEREGAWGPLEPLVEYSGTQEIFIRELDGEVHITAGIEGRRYTVELPRELLVERLVQRIAIEAGIPLSERNPQDSGEFRGWRVNLALPQLAGGWQLSAARVVKVEPFKAEPLLLARLVTLTASPNSITFVGPPGSGKTTALIGVLNAVLDLWPRLRVSIVEEEPEVATQVRGPNVVTYFSF
ncbi:MAG: ATPase, T2SS/T4P/T4SS family, partial [Thermofilaceae archaeon]